MLPMIIFQFSCAEETSGPNTKFLNLWTTHFIVDFRYEIELVAKIYGFTWKLESMTFVTCLCDIKNAQFKLAIVVGGQKICSTWITTTIK